MSSQADLKEHGVVGADYDKCLEMSRMEGIVRHGKDGAVETV